MNANSKNLRDSLISILRDKNTPMAKFRSATDKLSVMLAEEATNYINHKETDIVTPTGETSGRAINQNVVLVPVLRSGLALLPHFLEYYPNAKVGFLGLKRDETTFIAREYYKNIPMFTNDDRLLILDPMLATGGSACDTIKALLDAGAIEEQILGVFIIGAEEGVERIKASYPKVKFIVAQIDKELNARKYIVPGLGDFGDRYFGTE